MLEREIRKHPSVLLSKIEREQYFEEGAVLLEGVINEKWLKKLRKALNEIVERSRALSNSNDDYILENGHNTKKPRLKRLSSPVDHHVVFREFSFNSPAADAARDVVGPNVKFHHSKLNFKWANGGVKFDWHQDIQAWPHTDYSPVTVGLYLEECSHYQGPLITIAGSHKGPLHSMYDDDRNWVLRIPEDQIDMSLARRHVGAAGSLLLLNCRTIHSSESNLSDLYRPLLMNIYSSADSMPYSSNPIPSPFAGKIVRGVCPRWVCHDPRPCEVPPDWSLGYDGPWAHQNSGGI